MSPYSAGFLLGALSAAIGSAIGNYTASSDVRGINVSEHDATRAQLGEIKPQTLCDAATKNAEQLNKYFQARSEGRAPQIVAYVTPVNDGCDVKLRTADAPKGP